MTEIVADLSALEAQLEPCRKSAKRIALVPTMGNLHAGHLSLVKAAKEVADYVIASIFVNPTQFGEGEDFDCYPRTIDADTALLQEVGCDLVFTPSVASVYPEGVDGRVRFQFDGLDQMLCGLDRPGHFNGVARVIAKLLNITRPDVLVVGRKDYQQWVIISALVADLSFPVEVLGAPIVREPNGLAMSSRNNFLSAQQKQQAGLLNEVLREVPDVLRRCGNIATMESEMVGRLEAGGLAVDYFELRQAKTLSRPNHAQGQLVCLAAVRLGSTRLLDNLEFAISGA